MSNNKLAGKVQTVLGPISPEDLGITLMHEHCLSDASAWFNEPKEASKKGLAYQKVKLENLGWVRWNMTSNLDNLRLLDIHESIEELNLFKQAGGNTVVDCTNDDIGRDPSALARISRATGINIIMGSGYYVGIFRGPEFNKISEQEIIEEIIQDITIGVRETGVRAGIIGEIGCSWPLLDTEKKVLRAAAMAQKEAGSPITVHPGRHEKAPMEIIKILDKAGADITRVIIGHLGRTISSFEDFIELANTGCYLEFDHFGREEDAFKAAEYINDAQRIGIILKLVSKGFLEKILISRDICQKIDLSRYGGAGYGHILENIVPQMLARGLSREEIDVILIKNPKRILTFV